MARRFAGRRGSGVAGRVAWNARRYVARFFFERDRHFHPALFLTSVRPPESLSKLNEDQKSAKQDLFPY